MERLATSADPRLLRALGFAAALAVPAAVWLLNPAYDFTTPPMGADFSHEYLGGWIVWHGDHSRFYDPTYAYHLQHDGTIFDHEAEDGQYLPIVYPPFYYVLVAPLALLPYPVATALFFALTTGCAFAAAAVAGRTWPEVGRHLPVALPLAMLFQPMVANLVSAQKGAVVLLLLTATAAALKVGRPGLAGALFGLVAFKPQLTLVIAVAMLGLRQGRFVAGGALTGLALTLLSLVLGPDVGAQFVAFLTGSSGDYITTGGYALTRSQCWYGFFKLLLPAAPLGTVQVLAGLAILGTLGALAWLLRAGLDPKLPTFEPRFAGLILATPLISPHLYEYDMTTQLLAFALVGAWLPQAPAQTGRLMIWGVAICVAVAAIATPVAEATGIQLAVPTYAALLVALAVTTPR